MIQQDVVDKAVLIAYNMGEKSRDGDGKPIRLVGMET